MAPSVAKPIAPIQPLAERLLRLDLADPQRVTLVICIYSFGLRLAAAALCWVVGPRWLVLLNVFGMALYVVLAAWRRRSRGLGVFIGAYGMEWVLWTIAHGATFGLGGSFQLYPLLLMPIFVLLFHDLEPTRQLTLLGLPFLLYIPGLLLTWSVEPSGDMSPRALRWLAMSNEMVVAATVVVAAGATLVQHIRGRRLAEEREAAQKQLVEDLSHELRTPLATLLTAAQGARSPGQSAARVAESLAWIEESAQEARWLVERLLDLAELDQGRVQPGPVAEVSEIVGRAVASARILAAARGLTVELRDELGSTQEVDRSSLEVVLRNFLGNAMSHSPVEGTVKVRVRSVGGQTRIEVEDDGEGIAPEHLAHIFDRLWRADPARSRAEGRFGLGLSIALRHAELLGASIEVVSEPGNGATFALRFD